MLMDRGLRGVALVVCIVTALTPSAAQGQPPTDRAVARLEQLNADIASEIESGRGIDGQLAAAALERRELFKSLVETSPGAVLRLALPPALRQALPAAARVATEEHVDLTGTVRVWYEDGRGASRLHHVLESGRTRYRLHFAGSPPGWTSGDRVRVRGVRVEETLALSGDSASTTRLSTAIAGAAGAQRTLLILVNFQNDPVQPYTPAVARSIVFGSTDGYVREVSGERTWLEGDVFGWFTIELASTACDTTQLATLAKQAAAAAGANLSQYSRLVYAFPQNACAWWGLGSVGGAPSQAWINGELALDVAGHELGHNLGLYHSKNLDCGTAAIGSSCTENEYGDTLDIMGATRGHFNAFHKERLGWLDSHQVVDVTASGTFTVEPFETSAGGVKVLKILKSIDPLTLRRTFYYVEFRQAIGYDAFMSGWTNVVSGVSIHLGQEGSGNAVHLLDMTPETTSWYDPALTSGRTFADAAAGIAITTNAVSSAGAMVSIALNPSTPACTPGVPAVTLSPGTAPAVSPGTAVSYSISTTNTDSAGCAPATFVVTPGVPAGWSAAVAVASSTLAPGATWSTTIQVISPATATAGSYTVTAAATDAASAGHGGSASAIYAVMAPLTIQLTTSQSTYTRADLVSLSAQVKSGTAPVAGKGVSFAIRRPDGKIISATATTDANGVALYQLRLRNKDPLGTYVVTATTAGGTPASASSTFSVR